MENAENNQNAESAAKPTVKAYVVSYETLISYRYSTEISSDTHPELEGMDVEQMKEYIKQNADSMESTNPDIWGSLMEELSGADIEVEKNKNYEEELGFE